MNKQIYMILFFHYEKSKSFMLGYNYSTVCDIFAFQDGHYMIMES